MLLCRDTLGAKMSHWPLKGEERSQHPTSSYIHVHTNAHTKTVPVNADHKVPNLKSLQWVQKHFTHAFSEDRQNVSAACELSHLSVTDTKNNPGIETVTKIKITEDFKARADTKCFKVSAYKNSSQPSYL